MSERKVLNKYYPPDFDPTKIPKLRLPKNRTFNIRLMAPFNMRCNTCGEYIYKGKKFNSRKETVEDDTYLGLHIYRFYIKCPQCIAEISFRTDPANTDYELEAGATRNFEATRTAERLALKEQKEKEEEEANNPMKLLENRTKASQREMDSLESLEDLKEMKKRHETFCTEDLLKFRAKKEEEFLRKMDDEDRELEEQIKIRFGGKIKRHHDWFEGEGEPLLKAAKTESGSMRSNDVFKKPNSSMDSNKKRYDKIWASVRPKSTPISTVVQTESELPQQTKVQAMPTSSSEAAAQAEVSKPSQMEVSKLANSILKLADYGDSDDDDDDQGT